MQNTGRVRLFLVDGINTPFAFNIPHLVVATQKHDPADFQVWYAGSRKITLGNQFDGIVYAPNATVEIPFNGSIKGAIVANRIIGAGNNSYTFDVNLLNKLLQ